MAAVIALLYWFFGTELGASLRATGSNPNMSRAQGINTNFTKVLGLMLSNGLVALSSALLAQYQGFADVNMGRGAIVIGLAAVIIGEVIFGKVFRNFALKMLAVAIGAILYYLVYQVVIWLGLNTDDMKLITALIVAAFLAIPYWKGKYAHVKVPAGSANAGAKQEGIRMLEIKEIWKTFNAGTVNEKQALRGVSLTLKDGDFCTVIGGNGAGKSTMLNAVAAPFCGQRRHRHRRGGRDPPAGAQAGQIHRSGVSGPYDGHRPHHADRGKSGAGGAAGASPAAWAGASPRRSGRTTESCCGTWGWVWRTV